MSKRPTTFAEAEQRLASVIEGYAPRPQQQKLAGAIEQAIADERHLMAEGGCGVGKTYGYLIPSILSGKRVVVSTATKALQDQVLGSDLPMLAANLGVPFRFAALKGRGAYLCLNRAADVDPAECRALPAIMSYVASAPAGFTGQREDFPFEIEGRDWSKVAADSDYCGSFGCRNDASKCYAERARQIALDSNVLVVNHALYFANLGLKVLTGGRADMLGDHELVVFDEAHEVEEYAANALGFTLREGSLNTLANEVKSLLRRAQVEHTDEIDHAVAQMLGASNSLWSVLEEGRIDTEALLANGDQYIDLLNSIIEIREALDSLDTKALSEREALRLKAIVARVDNLKDNLHSLVFASMTERVRWVETDKDRKVLRSTPIEVSDYLREHLFDADPRYAPKALLVSATMSIQVRGQSDFSYIAGRLGLDDYAVVDAGSPFDFPTQARLYVADRLPDPSSERAAWSAMALNEMLELITISQGRTLVLFTSVREMRAARDFLQDRLPYRVMMQGDASHKSLAEQFAQDTHSVLLGTKSFMTGMDFKGETCSQVIIHKLTFPVPTEPVTQARMEAVVARGGSDFRDYTIPVMTLTLRQAAGRLIRTVNDTGVLSILDPRVKTKGYGKGILRSLPDATPTDLAGVQEFFGYVPEPKPVLLAVE